VTDGCPDTFPDGCPDTFPHGAGPTDAWNDRCAPLIRTKDPETINAKAADPWHARHR